MKSERLGIDGNSTRPFFDPERYPYGFSRSGDFTIAESQALEQFGHYFQSLTNKSRGSMTAEEKRISDVFAGKENPATLAEKSWLKYLSKLNRKQIWLVERAKNNSVNLSDNFDIEDDFYDQESVI
ncbi:MAG: DUF413 domain-containing protein [Kangiellaceae bacterium]|jgi:uncharacterized protein YifE (UPF0438 family)|nr:DUF413 domain-containing protein [Kangiellaceae bacterium]